MLSELIEKKRNRVTTLISLYVVLDDYLNKKRIGQIQEGLTSAEVSAKFRSLAERFGLRERYYETYLQRHSGNNGFFKEQNGRYVMREALVSDKCYEELTGFIDLIVNFLGQRSSVNAEFFQELDELHEVVDISQSRDYILSLFNENRFGNFGQIFEVLSYSILKVYFESFGFHLKRFSTSFSNDGGMDFISANGIYQVTSSPEKAKISADLNKLPGTRRVMVLSTCTAEIRNKCYESETVTEVITSDDLKTHFIGWLFEKDKNNPRFMRSILLTIREEMERETT